LELECIRPITINAPEVLARLRAADVGALCVVAFGQLLKEPLLSEWPCINVHFSVLPAYRGAAPVERALMDGARETGVSIMRMDAGLDTGPVARVVRIDIDDADDAGSVMERLCRAATPALVATIDDLEGGIATFVPQPDDGVSFAPKLTDEDRPIGADDPARVVVNRVRALSPHIGARLLIDGESFKIWRARAVNGAFARGLQVDDGRLVLGCADGAVEIEELQPPSRGRMTAAAFLLGYRGQLEAR
jgi:methionyl-tRNA formyltransferase